MIMEKILISLVLFFSINIHSQGDAGVNLNPSNEIKFISDDDMKYKSEPLVLPPMPSASKSNSFFDLADKVNNSGSSSILDRVKKTEASKIDLQDFSDVKFRDVYKRNEDGTYSPKRKNFSNNEEDIATNYESTNRYESNNYNEYKSSLDGESLYLILIIAVVVVFLLISEFFGRAKHIGRWWTFFLLLCGLIPGLIAVITSPSAKRRPTQGGKNYIIWAWIFLVFGILNTISLYHSEGKSGHLFYVFFILSLYLFELSKGNVVNQNPKYYFDTKESSPKTNFKSHKEEIKSFRDINSDFSKTEIEEKKLLQEILKFLEEEDKITLEIDFSDFKSSIFIDLKAKNIPCNLDCLTVFIVKAPITEKVTFFFRDSPKFAFSLTVDEQYLLEKKNDKEIKIEDFIVLAYEEPIRGKKITISDNMLSVNALIKNSAILFDESNLTQYYFDATSFKSYDYQLDFKTLTKTPKKKETLTKTTYVKNKPSNQQVIVSDNKKNYSVYYVLIAFAILIGFNIYRTSTTNLDSSINTDTVENISPIDTTAAAIDSVATIEPNEVSVDSTTATIENNSNNDSQITSSYFFGEWRAVAAELTFYSNGEVYIKYNDGTDNWNKWKFEDNILYLGNDIIQRLHISESETNSFGWRLEGRGDITHLYRVINQ
jgi:Ca2+/Na+ antiporter